jgi:hypothetical protein
MQFYKHEIEDGLVDQLKNNTVAFQSVASVTERKPNNKILEQITANANPDQPDLYYLDSILVTVGWNNNDDIFDPQETWAAKSTPVDKQFNFMHDETDIIGHITSARVIDEFNNDFSSQDAPDKFHIVVGSVLYRHWSDEGLQERMDKLIAEIKEGKWFVSMECLFPDFDYGVITPDGNQKVVARNDNTSFLTKHLRAYGGSGEYQDHKIGRVLRNFTFSGKGLVDNPANPHSIIFNDVQSFNGTKASLWENKMSEKILETQIDDLRKQLDDAMASLAERDAVIKNFEKKNFDETIAELTARVESLQSDVEKAETALAAKDEVIASLKEEKETADTALASAKEELETIKLDTVKATRVAELVKAGLEEEVAVEKVEKFVSVDDEVFADLVEAYSVKKEDKPKSKDEKPEDKEAEASDEEASAEEIIQEDDLEQTEAGVSSESDQEEELQAARASMIGFLSDALKKENK